MKTPVAGALSRRGGMPQTTIMTDKFKAWIKRIYHQLMGIEDTPARKAAGLGLGVFLGILPGAGPIAALVMSSFLKVNRPAALLGSLLTNTWLSVVTFVLSLKIGALITGADGRQIYTQCQNLMEDFTWKYLFDVSLLKILLPLLAGYILVGLSIGFLTGSVTFLILSRMGNRSVKIM